MMQPKTKLEIPWRNDLDAANDFVLTELAACAFALGLLDGRERSKPRDAGDVLRAIGCLGPRRIIQKQKLRQVYGAGFDLAVSQDRVAAAKEG